MYAVATQKNRLNDSRRIGVSYKRKYVDGVSQALAKGKNVVDRLDMTIAVDWKVKPQT